MNLSAVLLAGGESRRMGRDKALIDFRGQPLWQNQLNLLRALGPREIFLSARIDPSWRPADLEFIADAPPSRGPLSGIGATLTRTAEDHLLVLAIDLPFMSEAYLRQLAAKVRPGVGVVPTIEGRAEPLAAIYPREASPEFAEALAGSDFSLQAIVRKLVGADKLNPVEVSESARRLFSNFNAPSDLNRV
jgi:molybdenum cofactor guanylyltransferase